MAVWDSSHLPLLVRELTLGLTQALRDRLPANWMMTAVTEARDAE